MRILEFEVDRQTVRKKTGCDFSGLVAGTSGYLWAKFTFSDDWDGCLKAASFWSPDGKEHPLMLKNNACEIPREALEQSTFGVSVTGKRGEYGIRTNRVIVKQEV